MAAGGAGRLAIVSTGELFGGVERQIVDLCTWYRRTGTEDPCVVLFNDGELARQLCAREVLPEVLTGRHRWDRALVADFAGLLARHGVDAVHVHGYKATVVAALARGRRRFRLVKTEHGRPEWTLTRPLKWLKSRANFHLDQWQTRRRVDAVAYVTRDMAAFFGHHHRGLRRCVVPNGIDPLGGAARPRPEDLPAGGFNVGIVGRVSRVKGIPLAVAALARPEVPEQVRLIVLGTGPLQDEVAAAAASAGVGDRVHVMGFRREIHDYMAHLDALLMPSYHEGLPYTLLEAMSLGLPIVASRVGGLAETLRHEETGLLVEVGDVAGIAGALARLADGPRFAADLGRRAADRQRASHSLDAMAARYRELLRGDLADVTLEAS